MKIYHLGDQQTFNTDSEEYLKLFNVAKELTKQSPNKYQYIVKDVYFDMGQNWKWTTIINNSIGYQILSPKMWLDIVNGISTNEIINNLMDDKYWRDT